MAEADGIPMHSSGHGQPNFPSNRIAGGANYVSPIVKVRLAQIAKSNARLAGGANYVSPLVKIHEGQNG